MENTFFRFFHVAASLLVSHSKKSETQWELLWEKLGRQFRQTLFELEGVLIKVGQLLSIREDLLPKSFIRQIQDLVDQVPPSPWEDIQLVLEKEWGSPVDHVLLSIETKLSLPHPLVRFIAES